MAFPYCSACEDKSFWSERFSVDSGAAEPEFWATLCAWFCADRPAADRGRDEFCYFANQSNVPARTDAVFEWNVRPPLSAIHASIPDKSIDN
jgi:hypothetical protein